MDHRVMNARDLPAPPPPSVLVVDPARGELLRIAASFSNLGFRVITAATFPRAKSLLVAQHPDALVTALQLGMHNGLHLVLRGKAANPELAALVISSRPDPVLRKEAAALQATFVTQPADDRDLTAAVMRMLFASTPVGSPVDDPLERRTSERRCLNLVPVEERRVGDRRRRLSVAPTHVVGAVG